MIIISDTSPLFCLLHLNKIELLKDLFGQVIIPATVFNELIHAKTVLGVLLQAKEKGLIIQIRPLIEKLQTEINFRINKNLLEKIFIEANEQ